MSPQNSQPTNLSTFFRTGPNLAAGETCLHCGRDGQLLLLFDTRRRNQFGDWTGYPLHYVCREAWLREHEDYDECSRGHWTWYQPTYRAKMNDGNVVNFKDEAEYFRETRRQAARDFEQHERERVS